MFWFLAVASIFGYVIQGTLMVHHIRKIDSLSVGMYRNLTFLVTLLPLLFFTTGEKILGLMEHGWIILLAAFLGALGQWTSFLAVRILPVGINTALSTGLTTIFTFFWAFLKFSETITLVQFFFVSVILLGAILFALYKSKMPHLDPQKWMLGFFYRIFTAFIVSYSFILVAEVSRELDPFVAGYFWEVLIGLCALVMILARQKFNGHKLERISLKVFLKIALVCAPTLIGTGCFVLAAERGPVGIISAIGATGIVLSALLSWMLYKEKLSKLHWGAIFIVIFGVVGLKLFS